MKNKLEKSDTQFQFYLAPIRQNLHQNVQKIRELLWQFEKKQMVLEQLEKPKIELREGQYRILEASEILSRELGTRITPYKIREWQRTGIITIKQDPNSKHRIFDRWELILLKKLFWLREWGLSLRDIKIYGKSLRKMIEIRNNAYKILGIDLDANREQHIKVGDKQLKEIKTYLKANKEVIEEDIRIRKRITEQIRQKAKNFESLLFWWKMSKESVHSWGATLNKILVSLEEEKIKQGGYKTIPLRDRIHGFLRGTKKH